jgi:hypothetical protein
MRPRAPEPVRRLGDEIGERMKKTVRRMFIFCLCLIPIACATEKPKTGKGNLDFQTLLSADESTFLPFTLEKQRIDEIRDLFARDNLPMKPYKTDFSAKMVIPTKVKFKEAPAGLNERVVAGFFDALKPPVKLGTLQGGTVFICGPHLTALLRKSGVLAQLESTNIVAPFIYFKKQDVLIECAIRGESINRMFTLLRNLLFCDDAITVRKLKEREFDWYWESISYDIEEPIFIFENAKHKILIHFSLEGKIFFLDIYDTLNW